MRQLTLNRAVVIGIAAVALSASGCGDGRTQVTGQLLDNGQPYKFDNEEVRVYFEPITEVGVDSKAGTVPKAPGSVQEKSEKKADETATTAQDDVPDKPDLTPKPVTASVGPWKNTFRAVGNDLKGLIPGTYRVSVVSTPYQSGGGVSRDKFAGKYFGAASPFKVDIRGGHVEVVIDVAAGTLTTQ